MHNMMTSQKCKFLGLHFWASLLWVLLWLEPRLEWLPSQNLTTRPCHRPVALLYLLVMHQWLEQYKIRAGRLQQTPTCENIQVHIICKALICTWRRLHTPVTGPQVFKRSIHAWVLARLVTHTGMLQDSEKQDPKCLAYQMLPCDKQF